MILFYLWFLIFDPVGLVNDAISPSKLLEYSLFPDYHLIRCNTSIPLSGKHGVTDKCCLYVQERMLKYNPVSNSFFFLQNRILGCLNIWTAVWLNESLTNCLHSWLINQMFAGLIELLIHYLVNWLIDWLHICCWGNHEKVTTRWITDWLWFVLAILSSNWFHKEQTFQKKYLRPLI